MAKRAPLSVEEETKNLEQCFKGDLYNTKNPVVFDTNFLFVTFENRIDVMRELNRLFGDQFGLFITDGTVYELNQLLEKKERKTSEIKLVLKMLNLYNFSIVELKENYVDKALFKVAHQECFIATNDRELKKMIKEKGGKVIFVRQKSYLEIV